MAALGFFTNDEALSPEAIERRRKVAESLLGKASDTSPIRHWTQGAARLLDGVAGKVEDGRLNDAEKANQEYNRQQIAALLGGGGAPATDASPSVSAPSGAPPVALPGAAPPTAQGSVMPPEAVKQVIDQNVPEADRPYFYQLAKKESSFNPSAVSPTGATGLLQFTRGTGRDYGLVGPNGDMRADPVANIQAGVRLTEDNRTKLTQALGRPPTMGELALAHQQGAGGAISLLRGGNVPAQNLAVNNAGGLSGQAAAQKIMSYYGMPAVDRLTPQQAAGIGAVPAVQTGAQTAALATMPPQEAIMPLSGGDASASPSPFGTLDAPTAGAPSWKGMDAPQMAMAGQPAQAPAQQAITAATAPPQAQAASPRQVVAQAMLPAQQTPQAVQGGGLSGRAAIAAALMTDPRANPAVKQIAAGILNQTLQPNNQLMQTPDGTVISVNKTTNQVQPIYNAPKPSDFVEIGTDPATGQPVRGFVNKSQQTVTPYNMPNQNAGQPSTIPPPPPGVDPKIWREAQSKSAVANAMPADFEATSGVRKEIQQLPSYKNYAQAMPIYRSMSEAAGRPSKASDLNLVYGLGKIMDPGSVVREGEMVMVKNTASLPDWLRGQIDALNGGAALTPATRQAIMAEAYGRMKSYEDAYGLDTSHYRGIAQRNRMNEQDAIPAFEAAKPWELPKAPPKGQTKSGIKWSVD